MEVFPDDLPQISPNKKIYFDIYLMSDAEYISIHSYPMALSELKELKAQL